MIRAHTKYSHRRCRHRHRHRHRHYYIAYILMRRKLKKERTERDRWLCDRKKLFHEVCNKKMPSHQNITVQFHVSRAARISISHELVSVMVPLLLIEHFFPCIASFEMLWAREREPTLRYDVVVYICIKHSQRRRWRSMLPFWSVGAKKRDRAI